MIDPRYQRHFLLAGITDTRDQEKYARCVDRVLAEERSTKEDIVGVCLSDSSGNPYLYVVLHGALARVLESGVFKKTTSYQHTASLDSLDRIEAMQESYNLIVAGYGSAEKPVFKIVFAIAGSDWARERAVKLHDHLYNLLVHATA